MFFRILPFFIVVPIVEIAILIKIGAIIGVWETVYIVIATAVIGSYLVRAQGAAVIMSINRDLNEGRMPAGSVLEGLMVLVGGIVLLTPGLLTDVAGFALLIPYTRRMVKRFVRARMEKRLNIVDVRADLH